MESDSGGALYYGGVRTASRKSAINPRKMKANVPLEYYLAGQQEWLLWQGPLPAAFHLLSAYNAS
jgi:hypothetical protein